MANLDGQRFQDIYAVDIATGRRRLAMKKSRWGMDRSPDGQPVPLLRGRPLLTSTTWRAGQATQHHEDAADRRSSTSKTTTTSSIRRRPSFGWATDSKSVLISDDWDIWQVPVDGRPR